MAGTTARTQCRRTDDRYRAVVGFCGSRSPPTHETHICATLLVQAHPLKPEARTMPRRTLPAIRAGRVLGASDCLGARLKGNKDEAQPGKDERRFFRKHRA